MGDAELLGGGESVRRYSVREVFTTLQGEGFHAGTPATFVRFAGCNLWSGRDEDRGRDAGRNAAACPRWCDTDFVGGESMTAEEVAARVADLPLVVFTGGEPALQLAAELLLAVRRARPLARLAVETNGTVEIPPQVRGVGLWVCVSPKTRPEWLKVTTGDELKLVYPAMDPAEWERFAEGFQHRFVQPEAGPLGLDFLNMTKAARYCVEHPRWRLSVQTHKVIGLP